MTRAAEALALVGVAVALMLASAIAIILTGFLLAELATAYRVRRARRSSGTNPETERAIARLLQEVGGK
jgi:membrane protein implicated in regulation of membrane protease activity